MSGRLVVAPHPDDEVLGCSSVLCRSSVTVVHVTNGVPPWTGTEDREQVETQRGAECLDAWATLSSKVTRVELGFDDLAAWRVVDEIVPSLVEAISSAAPEEVYLPAYQAGHPDHDASYVAGALAQETLGTDKGLTWRVYALYGFDESRSLRFGWLPPASYGEIEVRGDEPGFLRRKADALRRFTSQIWPNSALDRWIQGPVPEQFAPVPANWCRLPALPCFYDEELGFGRHGASAVAVEQALQRVVASGCR
ncbi:MAG: PIG-L family deacetylase [Acidimicrobiaceae bacterium]|nr:PIG-L family deacetylase [Acidimicrobiaceae bacterium]